jgi:hypothetical protein
VYRETECPKAKTIPEAPSFVSMRDVRLPVLDTSRDMYWTCDLDM